MASGSLPMRRFCGCDRMYRRLSSLREFFAGSLLLIRSRPLRARAADWTVYGTENQ